RSRPADAARASDEGLPRSSRAPFSSAGRGAGAAVSAAPAPAAWSRRGGAPDSAQTPALPVLPLRGAKDLAQPLLLIPGQVARDEPEGELPLPQLLGYPVRDRVSSEEEDGRGAFDNVVAHAFHEVVANAHVAERTGERADARPHGHAEERHEEDQAEQEPPECPGECSGDRHVA